MREFFPFFDHEVLQRVAGRTNEYDRVTSHLVTRCDTKRGHVRSHRLIVYRAHCTEAIILELVLIRKNALDAAKKKLKGEL